ncbi:hypothetical protein MIV076L [Invertebrate iridescent virus 3]|uniref:Probable RAD2-like endonuclease 076L n=1 Tax=Invertebrate iridescent virus 3 TaxID=345201 RepID=VF369_IIV3|nr:hypothetical protein MIV076L [Invertebrate iridescent virus 3]Q196Y4.1 RecName: Full=Probable RAD2-like endonuclease 076L [Invertebrate iridescent virus 3]ABF82106.1 hypothetical protein MIV076L [Invertebrate iridescent virus 3]
MGIKNLTQFLKKYKVYETIDVAELKYSKICIDTPMFLYKFVSQYPNSNEWLGCFVTLITWLRKWNIHPTFVFEGKAPPEKNQTQEARKESRQKIVSKTDAIEQDLRTYLKSGTITPLLLDTWQKIRSKSTKSLLVKRPLNLIVKNFINVDEIRLEIDRRRKYEFSITFAHVNLLKELLDLMGVGYIQSKGEAEADCVSLWYNNAVDYIVSEDTDVLAYTFAGGAPGTSTPKKVPNTTDLKVITGFNVGESSATIISKQRVLSTLKMTAESFKDFCIMCGTDYNKNIFRVGVEKAYKYISDYKVIENVPLDTSVLDHHNVRKIFRVKKSIKYADKVQWSKYPSDNFVEVLNTFIWTHAGGTVDSDHVFRVLTDPALDIVFE